VELRSKGAGGVYLPDYRQAFESGLCPLFFMSVHLARSVYLAWKNIFSYNFIKKKFFKGNEKYRPPFPYESVDESTILK